VIIRNVGYSAILALAFIGNAPDGFACSCRGPQKPCEALSAAAVFVGTVEQKMSVDPEGTVEQKMSVDPEPDPADEFVRFGSAYKLRFRVNERLRGISSSEITLTTGSGGGDCGTPYEVGTRLLVFAYREKDGSLGTGLCMGNRILDGVHDEDILAPYRASASQKGKASVFGRVMRGGLKVDDYGSIEQEGAKPWPNLHVLLASADVALDVVTNSDGFFNFENIPNGTYHLKPAISEKFDYSKDYEQNYIADVSDGSCKMVGFVVYPATRIRGRLVLPDSSLRKPVKVVAFPISMKVVGEYAGKSDYSAEDGTFDIWPLIPGDYLVAINVNKAPDADAPYPSTYYPGVSSRDAASVIHVSEGDTATLQLHISARLEKRDVAVQVLTRDRKPIGGKGISLSLEDVTNSSEIGEVSESDVDDQGKGILSIFVNRKYRISARQRTGDKTTCGKPVTVGAEKLPPAIKVLIDGTECTY
jgi:hypothetical protein